MKAGQTTLRRGAAREAGMSQERLDRALSLIEISCREEPKPIAGRQPFPYAFPGAVALVARHGIIVARRAFGKAQVVPEPRPMKEDSVFDLASLTKPLATTTLALQLLEDGALRLDDTVARFFAEFGSRGKENILIRHLLTHTSGLPAWAPLYTDGRPPAKVISILADTDLAYATGTKVEYSCLGYILLGRIIELIAGEDLAALTTKRICQPLGLTDTYFLPERPDTALLARIVPTEHGNHYERRPGAMAGGRPKPWVRDYLIHGEVHDGNAHFMGGISGNAGLFGTAADVATIAQTLLNGGSMRGARLLSPRTIALATMNHTSGLNENRGFGWSLPGSGSSAGDLLFGSAFGHTGFTGTSVWVDPALDLIILLFTNRVHPTCDNIEILRIRALFANAVAAAVVDP